jgi:hypothetical protein
MEGEAAKVSVGSEELARVLAGFGEDVALAEKALRELSESDAPGFIQSALETWAMERPGRLLPIFPVCSGRCGDT